MLLDFKELFAKIATNAFLRDSVYSQLHRVTKVMCPNTTIARLMNITLYEGYKELNEKFSKAKRSRSFAEMLSLLFNGEAGSSVDTSKLTRNNSSIKMQKTVSSQNMGTKKNADLKVEKESCSITELRDFIIDELKLTPEDKCFQTLEPLLEVLVIRGQEVSDANNIGRLQAVKAFSERIDLKISVEVFLQIGVQAQISFEN